MIIPFYYPSKVVVENNCFLNFLNELSFKPKKLFLVTGKQSMQKLGILDMISNYCNENNVDICICSEVMPNPLDTDVDKICQIREKFEPDCILGIGGTSAIDVSKIVAMQATNGGKSWDYINTKDKPAKKIIKDSLPLILIPSTSGGGSESTPYAVITNSITKMKKGMKSPTLYPKLVLIDPFILSLMSSEVAINSGFDAFCQALESLTSKNANLFSDFFAKTSLEIIINSFEDSWNNSDLNSRIMMGWASFLSGLAIGITDTNLAHAMSHPLSALYNIPHGTAVWICTFQEIKFNDKIMHGKYDFVKKLFDTKYGKIFNSLTDGLMFWNAHTNTNLCLNNYNVPFTAIEKLVEDSIQIGGINTNPITIDKNQLTTIFHNVWEGKVE